MTIVRWQWRGEKSQLDNVACQSSAVWILSRETEIEGHAIPAMTQEACRAAPETGNEKPA
jgi:hypothetical protein